MENEKNRVYNRKGKGNNKLYHEVLSWHFADAPNLDAQKIEVLAREYFRLRNENAIFVGGIHTDKSHTHLHLCISGTEVYSGKAIRITKAEFAQIKEQLQSFELERFNLTNSIVEHGKGQKERKSEREYQVEARTGKISRREEVKQILERTFEQSVSKDDFLAKVREQGMETYERGGKTAGISDDRHMRFSTLGFSDEKFQELENRETRLNDLAGLRGSEIEQKEPSEEELREEQIMESELDDLRNLER